MAGNNAFGAAQAGWAWNANNGMIVNYIRLLQSHWPEQVSVVWQLQEATGASQRTVQGQGRELPKPEWLEQNRQVVSPTDRSVIGISGESHAARRTVPSHPGPSDSVPTAVHETTIVKHKNG